jgi:hypothetical protein
MPYLNMETKYVTEECVKQIDDMAIKIGGAEGIVTFVMQPLKYSAWDPKEDKLDSKICVVKDLKADAGEQNEN